MLHIKCLVLIEFYLNYHVKKIWKSLRVLHHFSQQCRCISVWQILMTWYLKWCLQFKVTCPMSLVACHMDDEKNPKKTNTNNIKQDFSVPSINDWPIASLICWNGCRKHWWGNSGASHALQTNKRRGTDDQQYSRHSQQPVVNLAHKATGCSLVPVVSQVFKYAVLSILVICSCNSLSVRY